jgi:phage gpG-like protein
MSVRGDFAGLETLMRKLGLAASGLNKTNMHRQAAEAAMTELRMGFRRGRSPTGKAWASPVLRDGRPLRDTGVLANSFSYTVTGRGFELGSSHAGAAVHQFGATIVPVKAPRLRFKVGRGKDARWFTRDRVVIPARQMLPVGDLGEWTKPIADACSKAWQTLWR